MKTRALHIIVIAAAMLAACSCRQDDVDEQFIEKDLPRLEIGGNTVMAYDENKCQLSFNRSRGEFGVYSDTMSDFFFVRLDHIPGESGQTVTGDVRWTTSNDEKSRKNITLQVLKVQGDRIWLWNTSSRMGLEIAVLE